MNRIVNRDYIISTTRQQWRNNETIINTARLLLRIDTMSAPAKDYRGIRDPTATFRIMVSALGPLEVEAMHFRSFHSRHVALYFCSSVTRRASFRPGIAAAHWLQVRHRAAHVPSVSRLYVACVLRQPKGFARVCRGWETRTTFPLRPETSFVTDVPGMETSLSLSLSLRGF